jgi:hypothetical protein
MKTYYIQYNIGKCKYCVSFHDGVQTHRDGSPFFGIDVFKSLKKMNAFIKQLKSEGYIYK